ncbi:hypothetical protein KGM_205746 [Danaus plexippus plexippus]|uniref:Uncharacterized protein n=1 Tax=Danaus plexippus plexippus TaxID=278856 RepID=A0A212FFX6_DANPL|nr:hypothetical protein KGM_205746 [Danaus plexippus plexippus]
MAFDLLHRSNITYFDSNDSSFKKYWRFFYVVPCALIHFFFETVYVISLFTGESPKSEITWMIPVYLILVQGIIKATVVCTKKTEIESIVEGLGAIWRTDEMLTKNQIEKKHYRLKKFNFYLTVFYWGSMVASYQNLFTTICTILFKRLVLQQDPELEFAFGNAYPYEFTKNWFTYLSISIICYIILYFLVHANSKGHMSRVIQIMVLSLIPFIILNGVLLFFGALEVFFFFPTN